MSALPEPPAPDELGTVLERGGARTGFLVTESGMLATRAGRQDGIDPETLVSLVAAQASAARALAPLVCGREFSELLQEGMRTTVRLTGLREGWVLASIHDVSPGPRARPQPGEGYVASWQEELEQIVGRVSRQQAAGQGRVGHRWTDEAESRIDQIFGGGS